MEKWLIIKYHTSLLYDLLSEIYDMIYNSYLNLVIQSFQIQADIDAHSRYHKSDNLTWIYCTTCKKITYTHYVMFIRYNRTSEKPSVIILDMNCYQLLITSIL
jgi:hypothetical protein